LVLLGPRDNSGAGNLNYNEKYENTYGDSSMKMIEELPDPEEGWNEEACRQRARDIVQFAIEEWGGLSTAHVHISDVPKDIEGTIRELRDIAHNIREYHDAEYGFTIPSIHIREQGVQGRDWEIMNSCPVCDSTRVNLKSTNRWEAACGGCDSDLPNPVYKFKESDYLANITNPSA